MGKSVIIVGGGAFGVSTAWHPSRELGPGSTYATIHVLDRFPPPSQLAAATDMNKIIRSEYTDALYTELAVEAMQSWTSPSGIFSKHFHQTGWLLCASRDDVPFIIQSARNALSNGRGLKMKTPAEVRSTYHAFNGPMEDWKILDSKDAGWVASGKVLLELAQESADRGVSFISGSPGDVHELLYDNESCVGARTIDGMAHLADHLILAAGANVASLIDMEGQQHAFGHTVCFIQLLPEEAYKYNDMALIANIEEGRE